MVIVSYSLFLGLFGCCLFDEVNVMFGSPPFMSGSTRNGFFFFFFFFLLLLCESYWVFGT
jgi:hypothetical protein